MVAPFVVACDRLSLPSQGCVDLTGSETAPVINFVDVDTLVNVHG
jgi:hypothetical protein